MDHPILIVVMRYLHIVSAILLVGGSAFVAACLLPSMRLLEDNFRESLMTMVSKRFVKVLWIGMVGLIVSGVYNWVLSVGDYKAMGPKGNAVIGTKVLLAAIMFIIIWAQSTGLIKLKPRACLIINLHLAAIIILLAGLLRFWRLTL